MKTHFRTHNCGQLREADVGKKVSLAGWVHTIRTHGNVTFIDLRDRYGITQIVLPKNIQDVKKETVIQVLGKVAKKPTPNKALATGAIEVQVDSSTILGQSEPLPLDIDDISNVTEETRLKYRFLDLRRQEMQKNLVMRHKVTKSTRDFFDSEGFLEIETPVLGKSTPEGARDYLVPSRINKGKFYALPQSPQIFKQLCMVAGFDRYVQIVRCFRDEDLRADRQPEFTQIDVEMSFIAEEDIYATMEHLMKKIWKDVLAVNLKTPFPRITYDDAMLFYGSDKPDLRFDLKIHDVTDFAKKTEFNIFKSAEFVRCIAVNHEFSRKEIDKLTEQVKVYGAKGLAYLPFGKDGGISKFISSDKQKELAKILGVKDDFTVFFVADNEKTTAGSLGALRLMIADMLALRKSGWNFVWVTEFPLMDWSEEDKRFVSMHHPFTSPTEKDIPLLEKNPEKAKSRAYDLTLNGWELGGGSIRIHDAKLQATIFKALKISDEDAKMKFGFLMDAFRYGAPPHGGIAFGLDRIVALMAGQTNIREVIAFPKTKNAEDLMMGAPSEVKDEQLDELGIKRK